MTLLLDGAVGTELARRGFVLAPRSFSAAAIDGAPELLAAIHRDYVEAGADIITTATTCVHRWYVGDRSDDLVRRAVAIARAAIGDRPVQIAGALAMLPREVALTDRRAQYAATARALADAGVDLLLCESFTDPAELALAARACAAVDLPRWGAIVPRDDGTPLGDGAIEDALALGFGVIAVHCCSLAAAEAALGRLRKADPHAGLAAYPALSPTDAPHFTQALTLLASRFALACIGACCGSTPATIAALR